MCVCVFWTEMWFWSWLPHLSFFGFLNTFFFVFTGLGRQPQAKLLFCRGHYTLVENAHFQGVKYLPPPNMKAQRGSKDIVLLFLQPQCYKGVGGQNHAPATLPLEWPSTHYTWGWVSPRPGMENLTQPVFDPWTVKPTASSYTNYATQVLMYQQHSTCNHIKMG